MAAVSSSKQTSTLVSIDQIDQLYAVAGYTFVLVSACLAAATAHFEETKGSVLPKVTNRNCISLETLIGAREPPQSGVTSQLLNQPPVFHGLLQALKYVLGNLMLLFVFTLYHTQYRHDMALLLRWSCCWSSVERILVLLHSDSIGR